MARWDVSTAAARLEFDTVQGIYNACVQIDDNHFINFWAGESSDGYAQVFTVNTSTWAVTTAAARLEFDTVLGTHKDSIKVDTNHFLTFWAGNGSDGFAQVFEVNTTTWAVSTAAASLEFDTDIGFYNTCQQIDTNHFINFWQGTGSDGFVQTFTVDTTTWAVTTAAARLEFDTVNGTFNSSAKIDDNHFINFWEGTDSDGFAQVFTVNTTTWAVTTAAARLEFDTQLGQFHSCVQIDSNHFINFWTGSGVAGGTGKIQVFEVNTTTWAVTTAGDFLYIDGDEASGPYETNVFAKIDTNHFIVFYSVGNTGGFDGFTRVLEIDTSDWSIKLVANNLEYDTQNANRPSTVRIDTTHYFTVWGGESDDGYAQVFTVDANYSPTVTLNTPADAGSTGDTTPTLDFTGTDTETNDIRYNVELDDASDFGYLTPAFDLKSQGVGSGVTSLNVAHTITGTNPLLVVVVHKDTTDSVTAVKWGGSGGTNLTFIDKQDHPGDVNVANVEMWYLKAPSTGTANVYVSFGTSVDFTVTVLSFTNMDQVSPLDTSVKNYGFSVSVPIPNVYITPRTVNALIVDGGALNATGVAMTPDAGQTERSDFDGDWNRSFTSTKQATSLKSYRMGWNQITSEWVLMAASFKPYGAPLLNEVSGTDSGFANPDTGGDTDPFNSGENIQFTVQAGDALTAGTYYWRVRAIDPTGSNLYGTWSSVRSFTVSGAVYSETYTETIILVDSLLKTPSRIFIEPTTIVDALVKGNARTLSDVISIIDSMIKGRDYTEVLTVADSVVRSPVKLQSETIMVVDAIVNATSRTLSEVVTVVDSVLKTGSRIFGEVVTVVDSIIKGRDFTDAVTVVDSIIRGPGKLLSEAVTLVDTLIKASSTILTDAITIVDSVLKTSNKVLSETVTIVDLINSVISRTLSEAVTIVDTVLKTPLKILSDVIIVVDEFTGKITNRTLTEVITIVDNVIKSSSRVFSEVIQIVDVVLKTSSRVFSETIILVDEIVRVVNKTFSEVFSIVDSVLRNMSRVFSESFSIVDVLLKTSSRIFSEVVTVVDVALNTAGKILSETFSLTDTFLREISKVLIENVVIVDVIVRVSSKVFSEVISLVDTFLSLTSRTFTEIISVIDSFFGNSGKELVEVINLVDGLVKSTGHVLSESITVADSIIREIGKIMIESVVLVDTMIKARSVMLSDEISIVDSLLKTSGKVLSESVSIADTVLYSTGKFFAESITVTDKLFRGFRWYQRLNTAFRSLLRTGWYSRNNTSAMAKRNSGWYDRNNTDWQD